MSGAAEIRIADAPARATGGDDYIPSGFPSPEIGATGLLRIGQTYAEVRALLGAQNPSARLRTGSVRFQLENLRTAPNVVSLQAMLVAPDRSYVETLRLRFTSAASGQILYFIHREIAFRRVTPIGLEDFVRQIATRFQRSTWAMVTPADLSYRQVFSDGRLLSWSESQHRPELGGCFLLTGGPALEQTLEKSQLTTDNLVDIARCGGGIDADWRSDLRRFTVTLIDFPLYLEDRQTLRRLLERTLRGEPAPPTRTLP